MVRLDVEFDDGPTHTDGVAHTDVGIAHRGVSVCATWESRPDDTLVGASYDYQCYMNPCSKHALELTQIQDFVSAPGNHSAPG